MGSIHRVLHLTSPHQRGGDVKRLQAAINHVAAAVGLAVSIDVDGDYGVATRNAEVVVARRLGVLAPSSHRERCQEVILDPECRSKAELAAATRAREAQDRREASLPLRERAFAEARKVLAEHVHEVGGNNRGPVVSKIIEYAGGDIGEPWCVDFDIWCYGHAGSKIVRPGFPRAVRSMAVDGIHVIGKHEVQQGDPVRFYWPGGGEHTGLFDGWIDIVAGSFRTIEGNTGAGGSRTDSVGTDGVFPRVRELGPVHDFLRVTG